MNMRMTAMIVVVLAGCAGTPKAERAMAGPYPSLSAAISQAILAMPDIPENVRAETASCAAIAITDGIPPMDQSAMLYTLNTQKIDLRTDVLFAKYMGTSVIMGAGQIGGRHYLAGRAIAPVDPAQAAKVREVAGKLCPNLLDTYPKPFNLESFTP
jgi:hypothetical protein